MVEISMVLLTIGAIIGHRTDLPLYLVALVFIVTFSSKKGILFSCAITCMGMIGVYTMRHVDQAIDHAMFGVRTFEAKVLSVDRRLLETNLVIRDRETCEKIELFLEYSPDILPGDVISVNALVKEPEPFRTQSGRIFDYPNYVKSKGISGIGRNADIVLKDKGTTSLVRVGTIIRFRIADILSKHLSFPVDGILAGMTVGYQGGIPDFVQDMFRNTGVLHVLVLSGYNITLFSGFLGIVFRSFSFRVRTLLIIGMIILLVIVSGSGIASVRAAIMGSIALFANLSLKAYRPLRALSLSYFFFFLLSPLTIFYDPGFHLSFLATGYMIVVLPKVERLFSFIPKTKGINVRELLMLAVTVPVFMLPYMMYFSGDFPLSSPIANILLAIVIPILMFSTVLLFAISWLPIVTIAGSIISGIGDGILWILDKLEKLPVLQIPEVSWWTVLVCYTLFIYVLFYKEIREYFSQLRNSLQLVSNSSD
jgi:competence protein ComEC